MTGGGTGGPRPVTAALTGGAGTSGALNALTRPGASTGGACRSNADGGSVPRKATSCRGCRTPWWRRQAFYPQRTSGALVEAVVPKCAAVRGRAGSEGFTAQPARRGMGIAARLLGDKPAPGRGRNSSGPRTHVFLRRRAMTQQASVAGPGWHARNDDAASRTRRSVG